MKASAVKPTNSLRLWLAIVLFCVLLGGLTRLAYVLHNPLNFIAKTPITAEHWEEPAVHKQLLDEVANPDTRDLEDIQALGQLRILTQHIDHVYLPRQGYPANLEHHLAVEFAKELQVEPRFIQIEHFNELLPSLNKGYGDIAVANLTITENRKQDIDFTVPVNYSYEKIIARADDTSLNRLEDLRGRTLFVPMGTSFWETAQALQVKYPELKLKLLPDNTTIEQNLDRLKHGEIDLLIGDSNVLDVISTYRTDFHTPLVVSDEQYQAWAVRKKNPQLLAHLNRFLTEQAVMKRQETVYFDDLPGLKKRKTLRLLTRNNAACYFLLRGQLLGFEYEIVKHFAEQQDLHLEIIVAPTHEELTKLLLEGKGDLIAAFLTPTEERREQGLAFSRPYHFAEEKLIMRADDKLESRADLHQRTLVARPTSAYWQTLEHLQAELKQDGILVNLQAVAEDTETEDIINRVADGTYDLTVADSHILNIELAWRDDIKAGFTLKEAQPQAWAVRKDSPLLLQALNEFHKKEYRGLVYNVIYNRYFKDSRRIQSYQAERISGENGKFSPYDEIVKRYSKDYLFDWRLIVAQMYQESKFDPKAKSWAGAQGLMQIMPRTAKQFAVKNPEDPEQSIKGGVEYLNWVRERFEASLPVKDRLWFALAGYNAGWGHVQDARRLAEQKGWNPNRWFNHVEKAMLLLSKKKYAAAARHGYVRGREPVQYVHKIRERYRAYLLADEDGEDEFLEDE